MSVEDNEDGRDGRGKPEEGLAWAIHEALNFAEAGQMVENTHFITWMQQAALPKFKKLYGKLQGPLLLPLYAYVSISYDVGPWGGRKALLLVAPSPLGGGSLYLGISYLVFGLMLLLFLAYLLWRVRSSRGPRSSSGRPWRRLFRKKHSHKTRKSNSNKHQ
ncbi:transmembrane domain-containing protein, putative [Eimeria tenella]|uniref:Transmembrane domain-containing protein, putative n=1 Tax=Eimeria tenella TaxID=5802 RepID=U6KWX2_EIMTE|nr:transmembrane domain-containing protein, putative [Eimeria tenella]CDJ39995.1 transmembrane domain-containing protein, putative [Eimeria tenella]|eukprot:XP_013230748.1 transmembrane domain-containing protein, putative [Eimeria tenella]